MFSLTVFLWLTFFCSYNIAFHVTIEQGVLDGGVLRKSRNGTSFYAFYGIPYAKPPVDDLRFEAPQEAGSWDDVRDAKIPPLPCIHMNCLALDSIIRKQTTGQEDCLYLNVFTPNNESFSLNSLPVLVYFHGGGFQVGDVATYDPMYFMDHPIVYVIIQFRLSMFGFLSTADGTLPGNMGMKDQVAALKWIQKNIAAFGGDPKRVTIIGNSSGAMAVHFHMYSPLSAGLFHRGMSLSGTAFHLGAIVPSHVARERAQTLGMLFGCDPDSKILVACLKKVPARDLVLSLPNFFDSEVELIPRPFAVVIEDEHDGTFLTKNPWECDDVPYKVPWIVGINVDEGCILVARLLTLKLLDKLFRNYEETFPRVFSYQNWVDPKNASTISVALRKFYFSNEVLVSDKDMKKIVRLYTDGSYAMTSIEAVRCFSKNSSVPMNAAAVYVYLYGHRNTHSSSEIFGNTTINLGICHADDLLSYLYRKFFPPILDGPDYAVSKRMVEYAVNFMKVGNPNGVSPDQSCNLEDCAKEKGLWLPVRSSNFEYLHIRTDSDMMEEKLFNDRYIFWKHNVYSSLNNPYTKF